MNYQELDPKILITGTGRCGTSFLLHLFHKMGYEVDLNKDTQNREIHLPEEGLEEPDVWNKRPQVLKTPHSARILADAIWAGHWEYYQHALEHVIIPIRDPADVVESHNRRGWPLLGISKAMGKAIQPVDQMKWLVGNLVSALTYAHIPFTILNFPLMVEDCPYLLGKLRRDIVPMGKGAPLIDGWQEINHYQEAKGKQRPDYEKLHW